MTPTSTLFFILLVFDQFKCIFFPSSRRAEEAETAEASARDQLEQLRARFQIEGEQLRAAMAAAEEKAANLKGELDAATLGEDEEMAM